MDTVTPILAQEQYSSLAVLRSREREPGTPDLKASLTAEIDLADVIIITIQRRCNNVPIRQRPGVEFGSRHY